MLFFSYLKKPFSFSLIVIALLGTFFFSGKLASQAKEITWDTNQGPEPEYIISSLQAQTKTLLEERQVVEEEVISFQVQDQDDEAMEIGTETVTQEGQDGREVRTYLVSYYDNEETDRQIINTETIPAVDKIIKHGTKIVIRPLVTPEGTIYYQQKLQVYATAYTAQSGSGTGYTATGTKAQFGTVAVDPTVIPLGTRLYIPGYGIGIAEDTGGAIKGDIIDLFYEGDHGWWEAKSVEIYILSAN